jgi:hypothetical protein
MHLPTTTTLLLAAIAAPLAHAAEGTTKAAAGDIPRACQAMCAVVMLSTDSCGFNAAVDGGKQHTGLRRRAGAGEKKVANMGARGIVALCEACIGRRITGGREFHVATIILGRKENG